MLQRHEASVAALETRPKARAGAVVGVLLSHVAAKDEVSIVSYLSRFPGLLWLVLSSAVYTKEACCARHRGLWAGHERSCSASGVRHRSWYGGWRL